MRTGADPFPVGTPSHAEMIEVAMSQKYLRVTVTLDLSAAQHARDLVPALQENGLKVGDVLELSGVVTGRVRADQRDGLAQVPGVLAVEEEGSFQLPPPDAEIM